MAIWPWKRTGRRFEEIEGRIKALEGAEQKRELDHAELQEKALRLYWRLAKREKAAAAALDDDSQKAEPGPNVDEISARVMARRGARHGVPHRGSTAAG